MTARDDGAMPPRAGSTRRRRAVAALLALPALVLLAGGCGGGAGSGGRLSLALPDTVVLDPRAPQDEWATPFLALLHEGLVRFDSTGEVRAAGARSWTVSRTGLTYTFHLRPDWRFEDGSRVTSSDCARTLDSLFRMNPPSPARTRFWSLAGAPAARAKARGRLGLETPDSSTLVIRLWTADRSLLEKLAQPRFAVPTAAPEREVALGHALSTGPYRLASKPAAAAILVRNPSYRGEAAALPDTITVRFGVPARRAVLGLASGRVDVLWPAPLGYRERLEREERLAPIEGALGAAPVWVLVLDAETPPTSRRAARYAVARALNRQRIAEAMSPLAITWRSFAPVGPPQATAPGFDPQAAEGALQSDRRRGGIQLAIDVPMGSPELAASRAFLADFGRASIYGELRTRSRAAFFHDLYDRRAPVASLVVWRPPTDDPIEGMAEWLLNRSLDDRWAGNLGGLRSPGLDSLIVRALEERSVEGRQALRTEIELRLADEAPYVPVARVRELAYVRRAVAGLAFHRDYGLDLGRAQVGR